MISRGLPFTVAVLLAGLLSGCMFRPTQGVYDLNFQPAGTGYPLTPGGLLLDQRIPVSKLMSVPEALERAPDGSVILACWKRARWIHPWGPCSHISRKLGDGMLADTLDPNGRAGPLPVERLYPRYAVIVLDAGVREEHLDALRTEMKRVTGKPYDLTGQPDTYYCSTLQNQLQRVAGLPEVVPYNDVWKAYIPADVLLQPHVKVLHVGVNDPRLIAAADTDQPAP